MQKQTAPLPSPSSQEVASEGALRFAGKAYLTVDETAALARCSPCTIRRAITAKRLTAIKPNGRMGRTLIRPSDVDAYMRRGTQFAIGESQ